MTDWKERAERAEAELARLRAVEPVAWTWDTEGTGGLMKGYCEAHFQFNKPCPDPRILNLTPLYAAPQAHAMEPWDRGVFKGADGLRKLLDSQPYWDEQSYGTRLYFGPNINDYLHRDVLRAAVEYLERAAPPAQPAEPAQLTETEIFKAYTTATGKVLPNMGRSRAELVAITRIIERAHGITGAKK